MIDFAILGSSPNLKQTGIDYLKYKTFVIAINDNYLRCPWADRIFLLGVDMGVIGGKTVLDYGCGEGILKEKLPHIKEYDPAIKGKENRAFPADTVLCIDVLEHIEPEYLDSVLQDIKDLTLKKAVFVVSTRKARNLLPDGRNAHLIIEDVNWCVEKLMEYFNIEYKEYHEWVYIKAWQRT